MVEAQLFQGWTPLGLMDRVWGVRERHKLQLSLESWSEQVEVTQGNRDKLALGDLVLDGLTLGHVQMGRLS